MPIATEPNYLQTAQPLIDERCAPMNHKPSTQEQIQHLRRQLEQINTSAKSENAPVIGVSADTLIMLLEGFQEFSEPVQSLEGAKSAESDSQDGKICPGFRGMKSESTWNSHPAFAGR